jgi:tellurite resistance protein TerC
VAVALAIDLFVFHRRAHEVSFKEALTWTFVWIGLSLSFNLWIYLEQGTGPGLEFLTGYLIEKALSIDNIFVFIVIFGYFKIPAKYQHRVLFWGILGAVVTRGLFVFAGSALLSRFHWIFFIFGAFLVYTGIRIMVRRDEEIHPENNRLVRYIRTHLPMYDKIEDEHFFKRIDGKLLATPLFLVLLVVELTDVLFAVDSIPAIFAVTTDPFLVFTSNIFAILGLRALYFVLADLMDRFVYLQHALGLVLVFVGVKMLIDDWVHVPTVVSLTVVVVLLGGGMVVSWWKSRRTPLEDLPQPGHPPHLTPGEDEEGDRP